MPAKVDDPSLSYSIGRRSYGSFKVANCEFFLVDCRGDRDMHDVTDRGKKRRIDAGQAATRMVVAIDAEQRRRILLCHIDGAVHDSAQWRRRI